MELKHDPRSSALAIAILATATIAAAWAFQLWGGYSPCPLCLQQRWPYYLTIPLALLLLWWPGPASPVFRAGLTVIGFTMLGGASLAAYHAGIEWHWWPGPQTCAAATGLSGTLPDLSQVRIIRCDEAPWRFLGLSFAGWNLVISLILAVLALNAARQRTVHGSSSVSQ